MKAKYVLFLALSLHSAAAFGAPGRRWESDYRVFVPSSGMPAAASAPRPVQKAEPLWYIGANGAVNFFTWDTTVKNPYNGKSVKDKYQFEPLYGFSFIGGARVSDDWRAELAIGTLGKFTESENNFDFEMTARYAMANAIYAAGDGLYIGAGLGVGMVTANMTSDVFDVTGQGKTTAYSPMGAIFLGYEQLIGKKTMLNLGYRFSMFRGPEGGVLEWNDGGDDWAGSFNMGTVTVNSLELGLKYFF